MSSVSSTISNPARQKLCLICSDKYDGNHFGIDSCRACAAFFRRSVVGSKKYYCRQGIDSCEISKSIKTMCRRCRLNKCLYKGMMVELVRDTIPPRPIFSPTSTSQSAYNSTNIVNTALEDDYTLLSKIATEYSKLCSVRKATELALEGGSFRNLFQENRFKDMQMGSFKKISLYYRAHIPSMAEFVSTCFPEFNTLEQKNKWLVFRSFVVHMWGLDNNYRTTKYVPVEENDQFCCMSETTYINFEDMEAFIGDSMKQKTKEEMSQLLPKVLKRARQTIIKPIIDANPDDIEYAFLLGIILWGNDNEKSCPQVDELSIEMRDRLYTALQNYYVHKKVTQYALRMGKLHHVYAGIVQFVGIMREYTELFNLMEAYESDSFIYDFIKT